MRKFIDINCDLGECNDEIQFERELKLLPFVSSANMCCGFHSGTSELISKVVNEAVALDIVIGAHPSYPDKGGFGRRPMKLPMADLMDILSIQFGVLAAMLRPHKREVKYIKPHGAFYHSAMKGGKDAEALINFILEENPAIAIIGQPGTVFEEMANREGIRYLREGFADRAYHVDGTLLDRSHPGAVLTETEDAVIQTMLLAKEGKVHAEGTNFNFKVDTICVHGDNDAATEILPAISEALKKASIEMKSPLVD
jgi:UPF0271 protein